VKPPGAIAPAQSDPRHASTSTTEKSREISLLTALDWLVIAGYAVIVLALGAVVKRGHDSAADLLVGSRSVPVWAVLCSMVSTELSAATFLGVPDAAYLGDWSYLEFAFGALLGKLAVSVSVIPLAHRLGATSLYEVLGWRFGPRAQRAASASFIGGRLLASGVRLFIASLALSVATGSSVEVAIVVCGIIAGLYTRAGGIRSVIYTDALQGAVFVAAAIALVVAAVSSVDGGLSSVLSWAAEHGRTRIFVGPPWFSLSDSRPFGTAIVGGFFLTLATHGTDADMVQRLLAARSGRLGGLALSGSALLNFPMTVLFLSVGTAIACLHAATAGAETVEAGRIVPTFTLAVLPAGLRGLVFAGLAAAAMSSLDSAICAIAAAWCVDVAPHPDRDLAKRMRSASGAVCALLILSALGMAFYHAMVTSNTSSGPTLNLVEFALSSMTILYGGLLGVFTVGVLTRDAGSEHSAIRGLVLGAIVGFALFLHPVLLDRTVLAWTWWIPLSATVSAAATFAGKSARRPTSTARRANA
jgi:SSS family solute:Na+ symporter